MVAPSLAHVISNCAAATRIEILAAIPAAFGDILQRIVGTDVLLRIRRVLGLPHASRQWGASRSLSAAAIALACVALPLAAQRFVRATDDDPSPAAKAPANDSSFAAKPAATKPAAEAPAAPAAAAPGDELAAAATPPQPGDLIVERADYVIGRNDLITVTIHDLNGPNTETVKTSRVSESGTIRLPFLDAVKAAGFTEADLEKEIAKAYVQANIIRNPQLSVAVVEARGRTFSVLGGVAQPGQYAIVDPDTRVLDALVLSKGNINDIDGLYVVRKPAPANVAGAEVQAEIRKLEESLQALTPKLGAKHEQVVLMQRRLENLKARAAATTQPAAGAAADAKPRIIAINARRLGSGELTLNIVIKPGDMIIARGLNQSPARLVIYPDGGLSFRGERTTWADLGKLLERIPAAERAKTTIVVSPGTEDMTLRQLNEAEHLATALAKEYGFKDVTVLRTAVTRPPATRPADGAGANAGVEADAASVAERMRRRRREQENGGRPAAPPATKPGAGAEGPVGEYYIGGAVARPGAYSFSKRQITIRQALIAAGGVESPDTPWDVQIVRRNGQGGKELMWKVEGEPLMKDAKGDEPLQPDDQVVVVRKAPATKPAAAAPPDNAGRSQWALREVAKLNKEAHALEVSDPALALSRYKAIKRLPQETWPTDLDASIRRTEEKLKKAVGAG